MSPYLIKATHTSPDTRKVSNLQFLLEQSTVCKMTVSTFLSPLLRGPKVRRAPGPPLRLLMFLQGEAASEITKAPSDNSTNYCSLQNLMDGKYCLSQLPVHPDVSDFPLNVIS